MSEGADIFTTDAAGRRERPVLFPWNRRLRHLQGISARNINVVAPSPRSRGRTITDDDVPASLQSPAKRLAQKETKRLKHSSSSTDLKSPPKVSNHLSSPVQPNGRSTTPKMRRRTTVQWSVSDPSVRQRNLEDVIASTMADTWFSLHCDEMADPVYISEVIERSLNPTFQIFDLKPSSSLITRSDELIVKLWARTQVMEHYILLVELTCNVQSLQFIGRRLENFYHPLPQNCILFHLSDGIYTSFLDMPADFSNSAINLVRPKFNNLPTQYTSSYDALMRLTNIDECIQDAMATRAELEAQMEATLAESSDSLARVTESIRAEKTAAELGDAVNVHRSEVDTLKAKMREVRDRLKARRAAMDRGIQEQEKSAQLSIDAKAKIKGCEADLGTTMEATHGQVRRICEDLLTIFPIEVIPNKPLQFTIGGFALPNSQFEDIDKDRVAAALGHTAQVVHLLSAYLSVSLPYPVHPCASHSYIDDPISDGMTQRTFPLYPGIVQYRFEYAVFLLNKNIEFLMNEYGLRMIDIRHTLPNLKYLLYVATSGRGELPARKAGGIKGLIPMSRRASEESVASSSDFSGPSAVKEDDSVSTGLGVKAQGRGKEKLADAALMAGGVTVGTFKRNVLLRSSTLRESF